MNGNISVLEQYLRTYRSALAQEEDPKTIISDLLVILRNYSLWEQELRTMAETHAPLSAILAKSAEIVHNPILISTWRVIFWDSPIWKKPFSIPPSPMSGPTEKCPPAL
jgi:hypothetical protein